MRTISKKLITGTLAAGLIIGGGAIWSAHQTFAAAASDSAKQSTAGTHPDFGHGRGGHGFGMKGKLIDETSNLLGVNRSDILSSLKEGKTLADIAKDKKGWTEEVYLKKLVDAGTAKIDKALSAGKLTKEQADEIKSGLSDRLKQQIECKFQGKFGRGGIGKTEKLAEILGISQEELQTQLKAGKSLADIAKAKGMTEEELITKIKDSMTDRLKKFVERKGAWEGKRPADKSTGSAESSDSASNE